MVDSSTNSKDTRVKPIFSWLRANAGQTWPSRLVQLATGLAEVPNCGTLGRMALEPEQEVPATASRLAWMIKNVNLLSPPGRQWRILRDRVSDGDAVQKALRSLERGDVTGVPRTLQLEGKTHADCLIECEHVFIWIEGKRYDWLSPSTDWDISRDQIARNLEACWSLAREAGKDYLLLICHEHRLKHHEGCLLEGYRQATWSAGWPHVPEKQRREFAARIGTLTWQEIAQEWPALRTLPELNDLSPMALN